MAIKKHNLIKAQWIDEIKADISSTLDGSSLYILKAVIDQWITEYGQDCIVDFEWTGYEDLDIRLLKYCEESDEDFDKRIAEWYVEQDAKEEQSRKDKQAHKEKVAREEAEKEKAERELYEKLKEKYGV